MISVISDTHSKLRPESIKEMEGCELIIHAGDIGAKSVIYELEKIAPLVVVRGNIDKEPWAASIPEEEVVHYKEKYIYVIHNIDGMTVDPEASGFDIIISGHSHIPKIERKGKVLYFNPGSAGPKRFSLPISMGKISLDGDEFIAELIELNV